MLGNKCRLLGFGLISAAAVFVFTGLFNSSASADTVLVQLVSTNAQIVGSGEFIYDASLTSSSSTQTQVQTGDFFTILDFGPATSISAPAGWSASQALVGPVGLFQAPPDSPTVLNLTFTYSGTAITAMMGQSVDLGDFTAYSTGKGVITGYYSAQDHEYDSSSPGSYDTSGNSSSVGVPIGFGPPPPLPLPASVWGGIVLLGMFASAKMLSRQTAPRV